MRENQRFNIAETVPEQRQVALEALAEAGNTGVDGGQATAVFDQVPVDQGAPEPMNAGDDVTGDDDCPILNRNAERGGQADELCVRAMRMKPLMHAPTQV